MKNYFFLASLLFLMSPLYANIYEQLNSFGDKADQESIELLEQTASSMQLSDKKFLLFFVRDQFVCCAQVFSHVYDDQEYMVVRVWKALFDELSRGEKRALFGHELMHIKNGDLDRLDYNPWLSDRIYRMYAIVLSVIHGIDRGERLGFNPYKSFECMALALVFQAVVDEFHYLYEFQEKRGRETKAELESARFLACAKDALSLNQKIEARLGYSQSDTTSFWGVFDSMKNYCASFYTTHPSRQFFDQELKKLVSQQELGGNTSNPL